MKRILTITGARPQFIKAAAISRTISEKYADCICEDILHTGQHYDDNMSGRFFAELDIPQPKYNLGVGSCSPGRQIALMLSGIEEILLSNKYDGVLVYGDTNSTLAGTLAATELHIPVYHVEAGLRSFNRNMPEETNRILTDHASTLLFAPTPTAVQNLRHEGIPPDSIVPSGDVMLDNIRHYLALLPPQKTSRQPFILATLHRNFNTDSRERLKNILSALNDISEQFGTEIMLPLHPRTRKSIDSMSLTPFLGLIQPIQPLSYLETLAALRQTRLVLTDSGGLQKEANFCGKACVILRPETEWTELLGKESAILADADRGRIVEAAAQLIDKSPTPNRHFGDGHAAETIIKKIVS